MYVSLIERKGIEKGRQLGHEQGIEQGVKKEKKETARRMLERGMSVAVIIDLTGLTEDEILRLKREG